LWAFNIYFKPISHAKVLLNSSGEVNKKLKDNFSYRDLNKNGKLDIYEDFPILYKKYYFLYYGKKVMTYTMAKKTPFRFPTERYLNVVKRGYKDCKLDKKYLSKALIS
jgi:hypothetical protein